MRLNGPGRAFAGLALSLVLGGGLDATGVPLGWLLGGMLAGATTANALGPHGHVRILRRSGQLLIGAATAGVLTQQMLGDAVGLVPAMIAVAVIANLVGFLMAIPFMRLARVDRTTAILSVLPAGMAEMASLASELDARVEVVTITHTIRVCLVVLFVPLLVGVTGSGSLTVPFEVHQGSYWTLGLCVLGGLALARLADTFKLLNAYVVVPMALGATLVAAGLSVAPMPAPLLVLAQILIGYALGTRLELRRFAHLPRIALVGGLAGVALISAMVLVVAPLLSGLTGLAPISAALGVAPGGMGEMIAAAKVSGAAVGMVACFQFIRSFMTNMLVPQLIVRGLGLPRR